MTIIVAKINKPNLPPTRINMTKEEVNLIHEALMPLNWDDLKDISQYLIMFEFISEIRKVR